MASPPFDINASIPGDNDIVSQHPTGARAFRDTVESWLLINHNVNGRHDEVQADWKADPASGSASITELWASSETNMNGVLKHRRGTGNVEFVGNPPGTILMSALTTEPEGYLFCYGQAVSRSTQARLFAAIGTAYGVGDGSTTFNLPDIRGRVVAGQDDMGGSSANRLTGLTNGVDGDVLGATGGEEAHTLTLAQMAAHDHGGNTGDESAHTHFTTSSDKVSGSRTMNVTNANSIASEGFTGDHDESYTLRAGVTPLAPDIGLTNGGTAHHHSITSAGGGGSHNVVQPTIILNYIIKT